MKTVATRKAIAQIGAALGPDAVAATRALFAQEQEALAATLPPVLSDAAYGSHERQVLDLYREGTSSSLRPVLLFVHGGGFVLGSKGGSTPQDWQNAHVGRWAARAGMLGAVMNYRLAPDNVWPAGADDVASAVDWLRKNAAQHGGDPDRIVVMGTSAGSVHVAGFLARHAADPKPVAAGVMLSGLYGYSGVDAKDQRYYGAPKDYPQRSPRTGLLASRVPLFLACAHFDPPRFQAEWLGLIGDLHARDGALPRGYFSNTHSHYSLAMHIGTSDRVLTNEIEAFLCDCLEGREP